MNRRTFLKSIGFCAPVIGVASLTLRWPSSEMDNIYSFVESRQLLHPIKGLIPFKLFGFQRDLLRDMHVNNNVVIIKCRQIGITNLMAVYASWLQGQKK